MEVCIPFRAGWWRAGRHLEHRAGTAFLSRTRLGCVPLSDPPSTQRLTPARLRVPSAGLPRSIRDVRLPADSIAHATTSIPTRSGPARCRSSRPYRGLLKERRRLLRWAVLARILDMLVHGTEPVRTSQDVLVPAKAVLSQRVRLAEFLLDRADEARRLAGSWSAA